METHSSGFKGMPLSDMLSTDGNENIKVESPASSHSSGTLADDECPPSLQSRPSPPTYAQASLQAQAENSSGPQQYVPLESHASHRPIVSVNITTLVTPTHSESPGYGPSVPSFPSTARPYPWMQTQNWSSSQQYVLPPLKNHDPAYPQAYFQNSPGVQQHIPTPPQPYHSASRQVHPQNSLGFGKHKYEADSNEDHAKKKVCLPTGSSSRPYAANGSDSNLNASATLKVPSREDLGLNGQSRLAPAEADRLRRFMETFCRRHPKDAWQTMVRLYPEMLENVKLHGPAHRKGIRDQATAQQARSIPSPIAARQEVTGQEEPAEDNSSEESSGDEDNHEEIAIINCIMVNGALNYLVSRCNGEEDELEMVIASSLKGDPYKLRKYHLKNPQAPGPPQKLFEWIREYDEENGPMDVNARRLFFQSGRDLY